MSIPRTAHFVWLGQSFPWLYGLGVRSAALHGGFDTVILHHTDDIGSTAGGLLAAATPGVRLERLNAAQTLSSVKDVGGRLLALYYRLTQPAARSNVLRAAILAERGGVYLDTDTICLRSLAPLLNVGAFCGQEHIVLPTRVVRSKRPSTWVAAGVRLAAREICRQLPRGYQTFSKIEQFYPLAVNNAVVGAAPDHPFIRGLLDQMVRVPHDEQTRRFRLGTHLLEDAVAADQTGEVVVHPPSRFYPLAPEISHHYFRIAQEVDATAVLPAETLLIHWYASVKTKEIVHRVDAAYILENAGQQLLSQLALASL